MDKRNIDDITQEYLRARSSEEKYNRKIDIRSLLSRLLLHSKQYWLIIWRVTINMRIASQQCHEVAFFKKIELQQS